MAYKLLSILLLFSMACLTQNPHLFLSNRTGIFYTDYTNRVDLEAMDDLAVEICRELESCDFNQYLTVQFGYNSPCYSDECYWCGNNSIYIEPVAQHNEYYFAHSLGHFYSERMGFTCDGYHENWLLYNQWAW
jgi:hypothetical protein